MAAYVVNSPGCRETASSPVIHDRGDARLVALFTQRHLAERFAAECDCEVKCLSAIELLHWLTCANKRNADWLTIDPDGPSRTGEHRRSSIAIECELAALAETLTRDVMARKLTLGTRS